MGTDMKLGQKVKVFVPVCGLTTGVIVGENVRTYEIETDSGRHFIQKPLVKAI